MRRLKAQLWQGFWSAIDSLRQSSKRPIVLTSTDPNPLVFLRERPKVIHLQPAPTEHVLAALTVGRLSATLLMTCSQAMCRAEAFDAPDAEIKAVVANSKGDLRRAVNTLQLAATASRSGIDAFQVC